MFFSTLLPSSRPLHQLNALSSTASPPLTLVNHTRYGSEPPSPLNGDRDRRLAALVARMASKDEQALSQLFSMTATRLHGFAVRIVRDTGLAEEVTEDTLFQAWREAHRFDVNRGKAITWLLTICRSRALDALRRVDRADCVADADVFRVDAASVMADPELLVAQTQTSAAVRAALLRLPANQRHAVSLSFFRGLTHQEIAEHWQMPLGSVKTLMHRAFAQLRVDLEATC